ALRQAPAAQPAGRQPAHRRGGHRMSITWNAAPAPAPAVIAPAPAPAQPAAPRRPSVPLLHRPRVQRLLLPLLVGLLLVGGWQALVVGMELPPYLVPSPALMMKTLVADWAVLGGALLV